MALRSEHASAHCFHCLKGIFKPGPHVFMFGCEKWFIPTRGFGPGPVNSPSRIDKWQNCNGCVCCCFFFFLLSSHSLTLLLQVSENITERIRQRKSSMLDSHEMWAVAGRGLQRSERQLERGVWSLDWADYLADFTSPRWLQLDTVDFGKCHCVKRSLL